MLHMYTFLMYLTVASSPSGPFGAEKRHRAHLRHEDLEESRHAGERAGKAFVKHRSTRGC